MVLTDGTRSVELYQMVGNAHHDGLIMAYLRKERLLIEADAYTPGRGAKDAGSFQRQFRSQRSTSGSRRRAHPALAWHDRSLWRVDEGDRQRAGGEKGVGMSLARACLWHLRFFERRNVGSSGWPVLELESTEKQGGQGMMKRVVVALALCALMGSNAKRRKPTFSVSPMRWMYPRPRRFSSPPTAPCITSARTSSPAAPWPRFFVKSFTRVYDFTARSDARSSGAHDAPKARPSDLSSKLTSQSAAITPGTWRARICCRGFSKPLSGRTRS